MPAFSRVPALLVVCLASLATAQQPDQVAAARVLGPHWKQISRVAGKIFTGEVISVAGQRGSKRHPLPILEMKLSVIHGIAGIRTGESLTIHEWNGASSMTRPVRIGEKLLLVLYPKSRLGLTSPVGGAAGQL